MNNWDEIVSNVYDALVVNYKTYCTTTPMNVSSWFNYCHLDCAFEQCGYSRSVINEAIANTCYRFIEEMFLVFGND